MIIVLLFFCCKGNMDSSYMLFQIAHITSHLYYYQIKIQTGDIKKTNRRGDPVRSSPPITNFY